MKKVTWIRLTFLFGLLLLWLGLWVAYTNPGLDGLIAGLFIVTLTAFLMPDIGRLYVPRRVRAR